VAERQKDGKFGYDFLQIIHLTLKILGSFGVFCPIFLNTNAYKQKEIGACDLSMFLEGLEAMSLRGLISGRNWSREEVLAFLPSVRKALLNRRIHALHDL
jgi:hypothetical protein